MVVLDGSDTPSVGEWSFIVAFAGYDLVRLFLVACRILRNATSINLSEVFSPFRVDS